MWYDTKLKLKEKSAAKRMTREEFRFAAFQFVRHLHVTRTLKSNIATFLCLLEPSDIAQLSPLTISEKVMAKQ